MSMDMILMTAEQISQIAALEKLCFSDPWPASAIAAELVNPLSLWLTAVDGERVIGYVGSQTVQDSSDMMNLAVAPSYRRQGVAKALVTELCTRLQKLGSRELLLEVRASNAAAIAFYDNLGFLEVGRRKNYYFHPKEDALILRKELF